MQILNYNKDKEILTVRYNTNVTWDYVGVTEKDYKTMLAVEDSPKSIKIILRRLLITGTNEKG